MLTNLEEVFQAPKMPETAPAVDVSGIEAMAQHESDRLSASPTPQPGTGDAVAPSDHAPAAVDSESVGKEAQRPQEESVAVSISETGAVKLSVLAAEAVHQASEVEGSFLFHSWNVLSGARWSLDRSAGTSCHS